MNTSTDTFNIGDILRAVASGMHYPVIVILIFFLLAAIALLGWILAEFFTERRHTKLSLPALLEELQHSDDLAGTIAGSGLLLRQKAALTELASHPDFSEELREALAVQLLDTEQGHYERIVHVSELLARLAPMFGLLGTLIPLGPGIIALGQGDTFTLSSSLLTAFDTTVAGLLAAAVATVISTVRKTWYGEYMSRFEALAQCILDKEKERAHETA
ncbi:MAG: MotA/TolQ/ExbB proton channel family protein [Oscillospiraceae bacterium]